MNKVTSKVTVKVLLTLAPDPLKGHAYLNKRAVFSCIYFSMYDLLVDTRC